MAGSRYRRPVAGVGHAASSLCASRGPGGAGAQPAAAGGEPPQRDRPREPGSAGRGAAGWGGDRGAGVRWRRGRARRGAPPCGACQGRGSEAEALPAAPRAAEWAECCEGRGRRGGVLPGPRLEGPGVARMRVVAGTCVGGRWRLGLGTWLLSLKM